jgi:RNA polymerase sigma-70 factor (ECF subfamily)
VVVAVDDRALLEAARVGDLDAFGELVARHQARVYRVALRLLGSEADAEDATQETFVQAWRSLSRFRGDSEVSTWLYRIVTNRSLNMLAGRRHGEALDVEVPALGADPAEIAAARERFAAVARAIMALPPKQRAALVLRDFEGLSYERVAEVMEVSLAAVKGRIHRARLAVMKEVAGWQ